MVKEEAVYQLLLQIIDSYEKTPGKGLPMGNQTSQWFALYYLDGLDRVAKEKYRMKYYTRYMDDCIILCRDKEYLKQCLSAMKYYVEEELLLKFNEKTQLTTIKNGVDYLGFHFYLTDTGKVIRRLRTSSKRRWKRRLKKMERQYREDEITFEEISRSIASYKGHLKHGHTYRLKRKVFHDFVLTKAKKHGEKKGEWNEKENEKYGKEMPVAASGGGDAAGRAGDSCAGGDSK
ncbi:MAG: RNA-directed DNA polymerase [Lachnospiraceae bacterium]|nr:RNA-directed DNA polymerase [Lachnospiraceae bacterium]